ncbi:hypothetical protein NL676_030084 [Syzygium grande]|nr:hypothetical protein NL676_030084 [Syzygium grande]
MPTKIVDDPHQLQRPRPNWMIAALPSVEVRRQIWAVTSEAALPDLAKAFATLLAIVKALGKVIAASPVTRRQ